jgi:hypothetical protein
MPERWKGYDQEVLIELDRRGSDTVGKRRSKSEANVHKRFRLSCCCPSSSACWQ